MAKADTIKKMEIEVYCCPTEGCPGYYGSNSMPDLSKEFTGPKPEDRFVREKSTGSAFTAARSECPICKVNGKRVERQRIAITVDVPVTDEEPPVLPANLYEAQRAAAA